MTFAQGIKDLLDGYWSDLVFVLTIAAVLSYFYVPDSCEKPVCDEACPWNRDTRKRRRYWVLRVARGRLEVLWDSTIFVWAVGRLTTDLVLGEATWTLPLFALFGAWSARVWVRDARTLETTRAKLKELTS